MDGIRANPPVKVLGAEISFEDLESGNRFPRTNGVILESDQIRVIIRPSGTEPKLKCYLQATADSAKSAEALLENLKDWASELLASHQ
jgi:phosphomannomutase